MKRIVLILVIIIAACLPLSANAATYNGGSGTSDTPYLIASPADINTLGVTSGDWSKCFKLIADINMADFTGTQYQIIGNATTKFTGTFDGNDHVISNLTYITTSSSTYYVGMFGYTSYAQIKNLGLDNVNFSAKSRFLGGLVGYQSYGSIANCYITGKVSSNSSTSYSYVGGLIGYQTSGSAESCYNSANISSVSPHNASYAGGLIGEQWYGTAEDCYSDGTVISSASSYSSYAGGLVASQYHSTAANSRNTGSVTSSSSGSDSYAGGLVGDQFYGTITTCCSTGSVASTASSNFSYSYAGGLLGVQDSSSVANCYSTGSVTSDTSSTLCYTYSGGLIGYQYNDSDVIIQNCYSAGVVSTSGTLTYKGGFLGYYGGKGTITACFWDTDTSDANDFGSGSSTSVTGKSTDDMQTLSTFTDAGWDFIGETVNGPNDFWQMPTNDYPRLAYEEVYAAGDFNKDGIVDSADLAIFMSQWLCEELNYDLYQDDDLHIVNFMDLNIFADSWAGDCLELANFSDEWLEYDAYNADIAGDDDFVNMLDFAAFAKNWMK